MSDGLDVEAGGAVSGAGSPLVRRGHLEWGGPFGSRDRIERLVGEAGLVNSLFDSGDDQSQIAIELVDADRFSAGPC